MTGRLPIDAVFCITWDNNWTIRRKTQLAVSEVVDWLTGLK